ncbi:hypothetical protein OIU78_006957 [Salix suchowensis]|nr:hypothetical protein OIU78_006957 [Salix suchowensis]
MSAFRVFKFINLYDSTEQPRCPRKIARRLPSFATKSPHRVLEEKFISLLQSCKALKVLHQIHSQIITHGFEHEDYIAPKIISCYGSLKKMENAHKVFDQIPEPNVSIWNAMFRGYSQNESHKDVIVLFRQMKGFDVTPNCFTFPVILKSCVKINALKEGEELHCFVIKSGFRANPFVATTLIDMYASGWAIHAAYRVFGEMIERNVIAWTAMINGYITCCDLVTARRLFDLAPERDIVLWNTMISGYIEAKDNPANYVMLSNIYGDFGRWKDVARLKVAVRDTGFKKLPGCSLIEVNDYLVEFYSLDERHPEKEQIYGTLRTLTKLLRSSGYVPGFTELDERN